jgi:hypothetical protein
MQVDLLVTSAGELARMRADGAALRAFEMPGLIGRFTRAGEARELIAQATAHATEAQRVLRESGFGPAADAIDGALQQLAQPATREMAIRIRGGSVLDAVEGAERALRPQVGVALRDLLQRPAASHTDASWRQLATLLDLDREGAALTAAVPTRGARDLAQSLHGSQDIAGAQRIHAELARRAPQDEAVLAEARELFAMDPAELTPQQWTRLDELLQSDPDGTLLTGPRRLGDTWRGLTGTSRYVPDDSAMPTMRRYFDRWHAILLPESERLAFVQRVLDTPPAEVTQQQWRALQGLVDHEPSVAMFGTLLPGQDARRVLSSVRHYLDEAPARRFHALWNVERMTPQQRIEAARDLFSHAPERLTAGEWAHLEALLRTDIPGPRTLGSINPLDRIASAQTSTVLTKPSEPWDAAPYFSAWNATLDPDHLRNLDRAVDAIAAGTATPQQLELVLIDRARLGALVARHTPEEQLRIATTVLRGTADAPGEGVKETLRTLRASLAQRPTDAELDELRATTIELIDRNIARMEGRTPEGAVRGYSNHPDYAEVGRIRANLDIFDAVARARGEATGETLVW